MHRIWLRWDDKIDLSVGGSSTELKTVLDREAARTLDDETEAASFLAKIRPTLEQKLPGYVWSIDRFFGSRPFPFFAILGESK